MPSRDSAWKRAAFTCNPALPSDEVEGLALELVDSVGGYTEIQTGNRFQFFWDTRTVTEECVQKTFSELGLEPIEITTIPDENWSQLCSDLLEPIQAADILIQPYSEAPPEPRLNPQEIAIIPGQGFGTGHHDTTRSIIEELSELNRQKRTFSKALDVGTGSGILAIAAAKIFGAATDAMDNDPDAIENARENVEINGCSAKISVSTTPFSRFTGPYDLILANIYAEVLVSFCNDFNRVSKLGTILIVSGITNEKKALVESAILSSENFKVLNWRESRGWCSGSFERMR